MRRSRSLRCPRSLWAPAIAAAVLFAPASGSAPVSSPEDRQRFVSVTRSLEQSPLEPALKADREWALAWLTDAPDVTVTVCDDAMGGVVQSDYPYAGEILLQNMFAMAVHLIQHPEAASDANAQQLAGAEGAVNAYRSILRTKPAAKSPALEILLQAQSKGRLSDFTREAWIRCSARD